MTTYFKFTCIHQGQHSQLLVSQICQIIALSCCHDGTDKLSTSRMTLHLLFFIILSSMHCQFNCLMLFCEVVTKVTDIKVEGSGETLQRKLTGMRVAALLHSDDHPSQPPSVAWQLWNVICVPARLNNVYISACVVVVFFCCGVGFVCFGAFWTVFLQKLIP